MRTGGGGGGDDELRAMRKEEELRAAHVDAESEGEEEGVEAEAEELLDAITSAAQHEAQGEREEGGDMADEGDDDNEGEHSWRFVGDDDGAMESGHRVAEHEAEGLYSDGEGAGDGGVYGEYDGREAADEEDEEEEDDELVHRSWSTEREKFSYLLFGDPHVAHNRESAAAAEEEDDEDEGDDHHRHLRDDEQQESTQHDSSFRRVAFGSGTSNGYKGAGDHEEGEQQYEEEDEDESTDEELLAFQFRSEQSMEWTSGDRAGAAAPTLQSMDRVEASVRAALSILNGNGGDHNSSHHSHSQSDVEHEVSDRDEEEEEEEEEHEVEEQEEQWRLGYGEDGKPYYYDIVHEAMEARWSFELSGQDANAVANSASEHAFEAHNQNLLLEEDREQSRYDEEEEGEYDHEFVDEHGLQNAGESDRGYAGAAYDDDEEYKEEEHDEKAYEGNNDEKHRTVDEEDEEDTEDQEEQEDPRFKSSSLASSPQRLQMGRSNFTLSNFSTVTEGDDEWQEAYTAKGRVYYYNRRTRESSWKKPENYVSRGPAQKQLAFTSSFSSSRGANNNYNNTSSFYSSAASVRRASQTNPETQDFLFCSFCGVKSVGEELKTHFTSCSAQRFHRENQTELYGKFEELLCLMSEDSTLRSLHYASSFPEAKPLEVSQRALSSYKESSRHASIQDTLLLLRRQSREPAPAQDLQHEISTREPTEYRETVRERAVPSRVQTLQRMSSVASSASVRSSESSSSRRKTSAGSASEAQSSTRSHNNNNSSSNSSRPKQSISSISTGGYYQETETCRYCGRSFAEGRLAKHEAVCPRVFGNEGSWGRGMAPQTTASTTPTSRGSSPFAKARAGNRTVRKKSNSTPIEKRNLELSFKEHQASLVGCPVCKRKFAPSGAQQHIAICKSVQNRPKNPVRLTKDFAVAG